MSPTTMRDRVRGATAAGSALLRHHRLAFTLPSLRWTGHAADILPAPGSRVWGVLWKLPDPAALDAFEKRYDRAEVELLRFDGDHSEGVPSRAFTYTVKPEHRADEALPAAAYLERMIDGAHAGRLPAYYVEFLRSRGRPPHPAHARRERSFVRGQRILDTI
jgi:hypothetical protein